MADERDRHLESVTRSLTGEPADAGKAEVTVLTILAHPEPSRAGERGILTYHRGEAKLSRHEPNFAPARGGLVRPLADPYVSRLPIALTRRGDGLLIEVSKTRTRLCVNGEVVTDQHELSPGELRRGAVVLVAERVALSLRKTEPHEPVTLDGSVLIGDGAAMSAVREEIRLVAQGKFPVLLQGESGTGKELVAQAIHQLGPRAGRRLLAVNMGAIPRDLAAAELFGARKGAYSGSDRDRDGYFQEAEGSTLFLDEIGEMGRDVQPLLLRALGSGEIQPLGAREPSSFDVRLLFATDADLDEAVAGGRFSPALSHRLVGYTITLPPLRERLEDFGQLFFYFLGKELRELGRADLLCTDANGKPWVPARLVARLALYEWPGNIRQLENVVRQLVIGNSSKQQMDVVPKVADLLDKVKEEMKPKLARATAYRDPGEVRKAELVETLRSHGYEPKAVAEQLKLARTSLYKLMREFGIRTAAELSAEEILRCLEFHDGDPVAAAKELEVSLRGLKARMKKLGISKKT